MRDPRAEPAPPRPRRAPLPVNKTFATVCNRAWRLGSGRGAGGIPAAPSRRDPAGRQGSSARGSGIPAPADPREQAPHVEPGREGGAQPGAGHGGEGGRRGGNDLEQTSRSFGARKGRGIFAPDSGRVSGLQAESLQGCLAPQEAAGVRGASSCAAGGARSSSPRRPTGLGPSPPSRAARSGSCCSSPAKIISKGCVCACLRKQQE